MEVLRKQHDLLEVEKKEDFRQYREMVLRRTLKERVAKGVSWYPAEVKGVYIGTGDKVLLELVHGQEGPKSSALQGGSMVSVFGMSGDEELGRASGVLARLRKETMEVVLSSDRIPEWLHSGKIGVDLGFDDSTYKEMKRALTLVMEARKDERVAHLREIFLGRQKPSFRQWDYTYHNKQLNPSQNRAIQLALEANDVSVIHGPPGTGKTTTLVQAIKEVIKRERQVLVCAPSNTAVDLLVLKCLEQGMSVVRLGNPARVEQELHAHTMDGAISHHDDYKLLKQIRRETEQIRSRALKFKRNFGSRERSERSRLLREARDLSHSARKLEEYIIHQILSQSQVVCATLSGAASTLLGKKTFHTVFIDEAAQALAPACWIPLLRADRVIFAGDHFQLPPTVKSVEAEKEGLGRTLLEEIVEKAPEVSVMLEVQYRMNQQIMTFSGNQFYQGKLQADALVWDHRLAPGIAPLEFVDTAGAGFNEAKDPETLSTYNEEEGLFVLKHLALLLNQLASQAPESLEGFTIGIIAPYKAQVQSLKNQLSESPMLESYAQQITINTVDGFQGQERDIIYISLTRSNAKGEIGFLANTRRMNVALTRARKKLVVIGDSATLGNHPFYQAFFDYAERNEAYHSTWEWAEY